MFFIYRSMHLYISVSYFVCAVSLTHSLRLCKPHLARHKYFISCCLHWMPLKLESFSRETMYLHATVSVRMAVTSLPAPLTIKRSAQNGKMWDWPAGHRSGPVMWKIIRCRSIGASLLFSYATFNYHIPIYDHSEAMIALAISLTECQEALSEGQFGKQRVILTLSGADVHTKRWYWFLNI